MGQRSIRTYGKLVSVLVGWTILIVFFIGLTYGIYINIGYSHWSTVLTYIGMVVVIAFSFKGMVKDIGSTLGIDILGGLRSLI
jgi:hypothetical protein